MSETPKFTVIDRRKTQAAEEQSTPQTPAPKTETAPEPAQPGLRPHLVVNESKPEAEEKIQPAATPLEEEKPNMPPAPTPQESDAQKKAYDDSAQRLEDLVRAQNPAVGAPPPVGFENLVQQLYISAMIQMGAGAPEGEHPRVDIVGARTTIDLMGVLAEKTRGNLTEAEDRILQTMLFDARMAFVELTRMITLQGIQPPPPPPFKH